MKYFACILGLFISFSASASSNITCLTEAIYFESRNQPIIGQIAVAITILNRVRDKKYPNTICKVVRNCQFSYYCDGKPETIANYSAWDKSTVVAMLSLQNYENYKKLLGLNKVFHYHANYVKPFWSRKYTRVAVIGNHYFYRIN